MAKRKEKPLKYREGPYEKWALGIGAAFADSDAGTARHFAAIAILSEPVNAMQVPQIEPPTGSKVSASPRLPTIWGLEAGIRHRFLPMVAQIATGDDGTSYRSVLDWTASLSSAAIYSAELKLQSDQGPTDSLLKGILPDAKYGLSNPNFIPVGLQTADAGKIPNLIEEPGLRLNVPIPEDTIDGSFTQQASNAHAAASIVPAAIPGSEKGKRKIVITAVIDDGIAFAHQNFRDRNGESRIECCWLQSARQEGSGRLLFGRELFRRDIDTLLERSGRDEEQVYASIAMSDADRRYGTTMRRFATHGTHVLDIAAGFRHVPLAGDASAAEGLDRVRILAVQLPPSAIADTAGFGKDAYFLSAFHYIFQRADAVFKAYGITNPGDQWLTVNFSFGATGGPHDGTGRIEQGIQDLVSQRTALGKPTQVIMPAGNTFSSALYGEIQPRMLDGDDTDTIPWRVQPNSSASSHLEIWFPGNPDGATLEISWPHGGPPLVFGLSRAADVKFPAGTAPYGQICLSEFKDGKWLAVISLAPTEPLQEGLRAAPAGLWKIQLRQPPDQRFASSICCRIQRSENPFGFTTGARQSYFDDHTDTPFGTDGALAMCDDKNAFVRRFGSLNGMAIGRSIWIVGGVYADTQLPTARSAAGPIRPLPFSALPFVDLSAPSDDGTALPGRRAAGTFSGASARLSGTSVAAPCCSRQVALAALDGARFPLERSPT